MMKKIVITGTRGIPHIMGGVEAVVEGLAPRLVRMGYDVTVVRRSDYVSELANEETVVTDGTRYWKGVRLVDIESPRKKSLEALVHTWRAILIAKRMEADVVHVNAIGPALMIPFARMMGLKVVFHHHGPDYDRDKWGFVARTALKLGEWLGCKFADHTVVISDVIRKLIAERCNCKENVSLLYNGVAEPKFCHNKEYFRELGIEEGKYILGMCRFVSEKRLHDLVEAYVKVKGLWLKVYGSECPVKLVLAGDTDFEDEYSLGLKNMAREAGAVLTGFVQGERKFSLLTNALCYSLPSSHEGLSIALLEAMSYKLPVITSAIPANLEVGLNPECYHKVGDVEALAKKLEVIAFEPMKRIDYDMKKYDWDKITLQLADIYDKEL